MANEEGVKIILTAEDRFSATIKKIEASTKVFGETTKNTEKHLAALEKEMIRLVALGLDPANKKIVEMKANYDRLSSTVNSTQGSLRKSSQQWTNIALVVQDLPYGFRAIQNNLPAIIGGLAGVGGAAYLAFSAIVAGFTFWDEAQRKTASETKKLKKEQESLGNQIIESTTSARTQGILLQQYVAIARDVTQSDATRNEALKKANELYGTHNEKLTLTNINTDKVKKSLDGYIDSLIKLAVAEKYASQIADNVIEQDKVKAQIDEKDVIRQKLLAEVRGKQTNESRDLLDVYADLRNINSEINKLDNDKKALIGTNIKLTDNYTKALKEATIASGKYGESGNGGKAAKDDSYINLLKSRIQLSKDDLDARLQLQKDVLANETENERISIRNSTLSRAQKAKAIENINETMLNKLKLLDEEYYKDAYELEKQDFALRIKLSGDNLQDQKIIYSQQLMSLKERLDSGIILEKDYLNEYATIKNQLLNVDEKINKEKLDSQVTYVNNYIKALEAQLRAELKLHKNNVNFQQVDIKNKINQLKFAQVFAAGNVKATEQINAALLTLNSTLTGVGTNWSNTANKILSITNDFLINSFTSLGESIGQALAGEKVQPFVALAEILASALVDLGKSLISFAILEGAALKALKDPTKWQLALAAGIAAVAAGSFLKSKLNKDKTQKFANGGIVSGPTYGLMGEYPGAASNPEVVAPLDKLKDMIGGGVGTLEARISGNDLLILMNKANRNNQNTF